MIPTKEPFKFLNASIKVLVHNEHKSVTSKVLKTFSINPIFELCPVDSAKDIGAILDSKRVHVGILGSSSEEIDILKRNYKTSYIIIPSDISFASGFKCASLGAKSYFYADTGNFSDLKEMVWQTALLNILNPLYTDHRGYLAKGTDILRNKFIKTSAELAMELQISERHLRNIWSILSITPKKAIMINNLLRDAYEYFEKDVLKIEAYVRQYEFYMSHRNVFLKYLST